MTEQQKTDVNTFGKKLFLPLIIVIIVVAIAVGGYFGSNLVISKIDATTMRTEEVYAATRQLQTKYEQLQNNLQDLQKEVQKSNITKTKYWRPIVIEHLVHMADLTLNTTRDTKIALSFLSEAGQYANDPELSAVKHALNKDIASLQVVPAVDASELVLKIEAISQKIGSLPMVIPQFTSPEKKAGEEETSRIKTLWQHFFTSTLNALKDIVVIRRQTVNFLISPEQEAVLRLEIQAKLLQAQLAVMQRKNKIYQACLVQTSNLVARYFVTNQNATNDVLPLLQELQSIDLEPAITFPTESIAAITSFVSAKQLSVIPPQEGMPSL
jgi:uroporphyrin-III C-methyltransferase